MFKKRDVLIIIILLTVLAAAILFWAFNRETIKIGHSSVLIDNNNATIIANLGEDSDTRQVISFNFPFDNKNSVYIKPISYGATMVSNPQEQKLTSGSLYDFKDFIFHGKIIEKSGSKKTEYDLWVTKGSLPILKLDTTDINGTLQKIPGAATSARLDAKLDVISSENNFFLNSLDRSQSNVDIELKTLGNADKYPKPTYSFNIKEKTVKNFTPRILDFKDSKNFKLNPLNLDPSLMRIKLSYDIFNMLSDKNHLDIAPKSEYVEVFVNDIYKGVYQLEERINDKLFKLPKYNKEDTVHSVIYEAEGSKANFSNETQDFIQKEPDPLADQLYLGPLAELADFIAKSPKETFDNKVGDYIDLNSAIDNHILFLLTGNQDEIALNQYTYRSNAANATGKFLFSPGDFNISSFGRDSDSAMINSYKKGFTLNLLFSRLYEDQSYMQNLKSRWYILRKDIITPENIGRLIDENYRTLKFVQERNFKAYPIKSTSDESQNISFDSEINYMKEFINRRILWVDSQMYNYFLKIGSSQAKIYEEYNTIFCTLPPGSDPIQAIEYNFKPDTKIYIETKSYGSKNASDGFESGNLTSWSSSYTDNGDLSVAAKAKILGNYELSCVLDDTTQIIVQDDTPFAEKRYRCRFYIDPNSLTMAPNDEFGIFKGFMADGTNVFSVCLKYEDGSYKIYAADRNDGRWRFTNSYAISDAPHYIEVDWKASTGADANNGEFKIWIDGFLKETVSNVDNDTEVIDFIIFGASGVETGTSGTFYLDDFVSNNDGTAIGFGPGVQSGRITNGQKFNFKDFIFHGNLIVENSKTSEKYDLWITTGNLPIIFISTNYSDLNINYKVDGKIKVIDNSEYFEENIGIKYRGFTSYGVPKKQFSIEIRDDDGNPKNIELLGLPEENDWILGGIYIDKTLIRNAVAFKLSNEIGLYAPRNKFLELFLADNKSYGTYVGVYSLTENVKVDKNRVDITKVQNVNKNNFNVNIPDTGAYNGYILQISDDPKKNRPEDLLMVTNRGMILRIDYPKEDEINEAQKKWITDYINEFEKTLYSDNFNDPVEGYLKYVDLDSLVDFMIINQLFKNVDTFHFSTFITKDVNGKLNFGPVWDFELSSGEVFTLPLNKEVEGWMYLKRRLSERFFMDDNFVNKFGTRWKELRKSVLSDDNIENIIKSYASELTSTDSQIRNFEKWPVFNKSIRNEPEQYTEEIDRMRVWLIKRAKWLDDNIDLIIQDAQRVT